MPYRIGKQIHELLMKSQIIRIIPHQNPDGDAIGAVSSLGSCLKRRNKNVEIFCTTTVPSQLQHMPLADTIVSDPVLWDSPCDVIIVCDSGDAVYAGINKYLEKNTKAIVVVIDHHPNNTRFGDINLVSTTHSSTCELLYDYFVANQITITPDMATNLLCGIMYDTGSFTNSATSKKSLMVAGVLVKLGGALTKVVRYLYKDKQVSTLKLWGNAMSNLRHDTEHDVVHMCLTLEDMRVCGADEDSANGVANFMSILKDGRIHMVLREQHNGMVKVSMRTKRDDTDVAEIAREFGGGGHKKAAGFTFATPIAEAYPKMLPILNKYLKKV